MNCRTSLTLLLTLALVSACSQDPFGNGPAGDLDLSCRDCNVLFLNVELLRGDYVGLFNPDKKHTPNIDEFFKDGIIFEQVSAPGGATFTSNIATMTAMEGLAIRHYPVFENTSADTKRELNQILPKLNTFRTIVEDLRDGGYHTININDGIFAGRQVGMDRGFEKYLEMRRTKDHRFYLSLSVLMHVLTLEKEFPFFILYRAKPLHADYDYPAFIPEALGVKRWDRSPNHVNYPKQLFYTDAGLSILFKNALHKELLENTIVVLYATHGESLGEQGIYKHGVLYQSCVHVPVLIKHPKVNRPIHVKTPVSLIDLGPTILDMLGVEIRQDIAGISLVPVIQGKPYEREFIFGKAYESRYVRKGNWKLIRWDNGSYELYNVKDDPYETQNLYGDKVEVGDKLRIVLRDQEISLSARGISSQDSSHNASTGAPAIRR